MLQKIIALTEQSIDAQKAAAEGFCQMQKGCIQMGRCVMVSFGYHAGTGAKSG
jgi:hypothetical protein